ncbi:uncharacterized protein LOC113759078 [Coffea eugenioides]|uniref:uncharacterized protein LOC113759078 n=1 Tax=Coffea eugenioides TaxID=49369 RepID=UPI000F60572A|nr:uncharacterized protein LOC113759078 [Coffea eugenioides]
MGRKRKSISEDEHRIQANQRRRERYAKKAAEKQQKTQQSTEYENRISHTSHAMPFSPIDDTLVDAPIHNDVSLSALLKAKCEIHLAETQMPEKLVQFYRANAPKAREFRLCIRSYNNMFAFTSLGVHYDKNLSRRNNGIYTFRVQGQIYHFINPLVPSKGERATNLQLYFYDTQHEIANRMAISSKFRESIFQQFKDILHDNPYSTFIRSLVDLHDLEDHKIFLKSDPGLDQRVYNLPAVSQVAAMWNENDYNSGDGTQNIHIFTKIGRKRMLKQYYGCYDTLQYPLIFAKGETGWHKDILRIPRSDVLNQSGSTCQNQNILSVQNCSHIDEVISAEEKASFIGGPRDMRRRYLDAMSLVQRYGKPDIFLTMTCNPSWPEIKQHLSGEDEIQNRPDLISRVFRAKIEQLEDDLFKRNLFGEVATYTYVIEFQKRGLPHAHFLIILKQG